MKNKILGLLPVIVFLAIFSTQSVAGEAYTPGKGSVERKAIIESIRAAYTKRFKKRATFEVWDIKIQDGWAAIYTKAELPDGKNGGNWSAALRGSKSKWQIVGAYKDQENIAGLRRLTKRYPNIPSAIRIVLDTA